MNGLHQATPLLRVLLIDDDEDTYILTRDMLLDIVEPRYEVDWECSYSSGLSTMSRNEHQVYLVDYQLGSRNGLELIQDARESGCRGAIIFLTGMENQYLDLMAMTNGASDYLVKGRFNTALLDRSIRYARSHQEDLYSLQRSSQELLRLNAELRQSEINLKELNARKDRFFSIIAHSLRKPFVPLLGYSELLAKDIHEMKTEEIESNANLLHEVGTRLYRLLENLLKWSRLQTGKISCQPVNLDVGRIAAQTVADFADDAAKKDISIRNFISPSVYTFADPEMVETIMENLVSNAVKYTPRGGLVELHVQSNNASIQLEVRDTGVGIAKEVFAELFQIDRKLAGLGTEQEDGTGLGLILCKEYADRCGALLEATSSPGQGSTFRLIMPRIDLLSSGSLSDVLKRMTRLETSPPTRN
jgi:signal transduction histidine kinase